jgi:hypothetical protein
MAKGKKFVDAMMKVKTPAQMKAEMAVERARTVLPKDEREANQAKFLESSKISDRLYHITPENFSEFKPGGNDPKISGSAIWLTPNTEHIPAAHRISYRDEEGKTYPISGRNAKYRQGTNVMPVYAQAKNPLVLDDPVMIDWAQTVFAGGSREFPELMPQKWVNEVRKEGYDSIIFADPRNTGQSHEVIMFEPTQIKSAIGNRGTYDTSDPDITKAHGGIVKMGKGGVGRKIADKLLPKVETSRIDMSFKDVTKRTPELQEAAQRVAAGEMSAAEYDALVNQVKPVTPYNFVPTPATREEAISALTANKKEKYGAAKDWEAGTPVGLRLDIPAYSDHGVWVNSIHGPDSTAYGNVSAVTDARFGNFDDKALKVAQGAAKSPFAKIEGKWSPIEEEEAVRRASEYLQSPEWRQVGMDPERHGYFYDRKTMEPIVASEEVIQIGPLVLAKNPVYGDKGDFKFAHGGAVKMAEGGEPSQAELDRMRLELNTPVIQATPQSPIQRGIGTIGGYMDRAGQFVSKSLEPIAETHPVKHFLGELLLADTLKSAGTALQDYTKTSRDYTEDNPYKRAPITGKGQTMSLDPRMLDVVGLAQPAASLGIKGVRAGAKAAAPFAKDVGEMASELYMRGDIPGMVSPNAYVIKPKGGNWLGGGIDAGIDPLRSTRIAGQTPAERIPLHEALLNDPSLNADQLERVQYQLNVAKGEASVDKWIDTKLKKYVQNELATPEDPIRALAAKGVSHMSDEALEASSRWVPDDLGIKRRAAGFPEENMADIDYRKAVAKSIIGEGAEPDAATTDAYRRAGGWETIADTSIYNSPASRWLDRKNEVGFAAVIKDNPFLEKAPPETRFNTVSESSTFATDLGFDHLVDELKNATRIDSDLPEKLRIEPSKLEKMTVPQVVERVSEINKWRAENQAAANQKLAMNPATQVVKEYPDQGYKWVELTKPKNIELPEGYRVVPDPITNRKTGAVDTNSYRLVDADERMVGWGATEEEAISSSLGEQTLKDALKYEGDTMGHCVGSYCPDVMEGKTRIYSLRDSKGEPHVTIEVGAPRSPGWAEVREAGGDPLAVTQEAKRRMGITPENERELVKSWDGTKRAQAKEDLDRHFADVYREQFGEPPSRIVQIKGKGNAKPKDTYLPFVQDFVKGGKWSDVGDLKNTGLVREGNQYMTPDEYSDWLLKQTGAPSDGMKRGGKVQFANNIDAMRLALSKG